MIRGRALVLAASAWLALATACGAAPQPPLGGPEGDEPAKPQARRRADLADDCAPIPGKPPPKPLVKQYTGVAAKARCQREVYTIMGGITHFLGVKCAYCHEEPDYAKMTHKKLVANWMARELIPSLSRKNGTGEIWCNDCHVVDGKGTAKILRAPRDQRWAIEWMSTHLVDELDAADGRPLRCKDCHEGNIGSREFRGKVILTERLPRKLERPRPEDAPPLPEPPDAGASRAGPAGDAATEQ